MSFTGDGLTACTIVAKNYLPFARVLARSFLDHHPGGRMVVLLMDRVDGCFDPAAEPFEVVEVEELGIPDFRSFAFKYTLLEVSTAVKPFFLARLLAREGVEKLLYLDPDVQVFRPLAELADLLDRRSVVLTPHLTDPIDDDHHPSEMSILQAGAYNLGFLGLAPGREVERLLTWWRERVYEHCVVDVARGLFVDQKWMDLVPGLFAGAGVHVLAHPGYNVAYWNLHGREVTLAGEPPEPRVNGEPLFFFHFSGIDPDDPGRVSRHQDRFTLGTLGEGARRLILAYRERLLAAGFRETRPWPYAFGRFDDGTPVPDLARSLYFSLGAGRARFGDPFATGEGSFFAWANGPARSAAPGAPHLSRLLEHLHRTRPDLVLDLPDVHGRDLARFAEWLAEGGSREYRLGEVFLDPVRPLLAPPARPAAAVASRARRTVRRAGSSRLGRKVRFHVKRALGADRAAALKRRLPGFGPRGEPASPGREPLAELSIVRFGVNVAGYITTESGMGEGVRGVIRALAHAGVPHSLQNVELGVESRMGDASFAAAGSVFDYDVNLFFVNADQVPHVAAHLGRERFRRKVNVGFWLWELEEFPRRWRSSFDPFHEIWTPSRFCLDAIAGLSPIPVRRVGLPVTFEPPGAVDRALVGLPEDRFVFLFVFDFLSYLERKNPLGLIEAFKRAFRPDEPVSLVLKTINAGHNPEGAGQVRAAASGWPVEVRDEYLSKEEVHRLMAAADCYVSLHRSEGYGLTLAEAMLLGKPVIATDYSGSTDFLTAGHGFPVRYELVTLERDEGPYERGNRWAEPDLDHAAERMRRVFERPEEAREVGERARRHVAEHHGVAAAAAVIRRRLARLVEEVNGPAGDHFGL